MLSGHEQWPRSLSFAVDGNFQTQIFMCVKNILKLLYLFAFSDCLLLFSVSGMLYVLEANIYKTVHCIVS